MALVVILTCVRACLYYAHRYKTLHWLVVYVCDMKLHVPLMSHIIVLGAIGNGSWWAVMFTGAKRRLIMTQYTYQYVPLLYLEIQALLNRSMSITYSNYCDGNIFKSHLLIPMPFKSLSFLTSWNYVTDINKTYKLGIFSGTYHCCLITVFSRRTT